MYTPEEISSIIHARVLVPDPHAKTDLLLTDSRKVVNAARSLFFALAGKKDAHLFITELYRAGVRNFVITRDDFNTDPYPEANFYWVDDALKALQMLAAAHRNQFSYPVIGITGSNGKTIVKDWLYQLLSPDHHMVRSPKSYNSQIGVPLSVWQMNESHQLAIFEAGISLPGEMRSLEQVMRPNLGILTNIKTAHDEGFDSQDQKLQEKLQLFDRAQTLIYSPDYVDASVSIKAPERFTWSFRAEADLQVTRVEKQAGRSVIYALYHSEEKKLEVHFTDEASIENIVVCWAVMLYLRYEDEQIAGRMKSLHPVAMRLELKQGIHNCSVINDSYSADLNSLYIAVDFLNQQKQHAKKTVILSDILQSKEENLYPQIAAFLAQNGVSRLIGIGAEISAHAAAFPMQSLFFPGTEAFMEQVQDIAFDSETILLKGARKFEFERISKLLEQKVHETVLEINLNAIANNLNFYRSRLKPNVKMMVMVKAFSYGSGSFEIANVLQYHKADYLAVAYADEGVSLRKSGITLPVMVMSPEVSAFEAIVKHCLEPEIYSFRILQAFSDYLRSIGMKLYPIHIKIDTGMRRLGFEEEQVDELLSILKGMEEVKIRSVFSHLAGSEEAVHDSFTAEQITRFDRISAKLVSNTPYPVIRHIANTAGILRFPHAHYEMTRLGIGLYGVDNTGEYASQLQQVGTLKTTVSQVKHVKKGETVGYSRKGIASEDTMIATVKIGYADGYVRAFGNGKGYMMINGQKAPTIGNICMDMCMLNVTGLQVKEGDEAIVFGEVPAITELAGQAGTIAYELLTNISQRVKRVYYYE